MPSIDILGVQLAALSAHTALEEIENLYLGDAPAFVAYVNVHTLNLARRDPTFRAVLNRADLALPDGKGVLLGARILDRRFPADLNGNFFSPLMLEVAARRRWPVYFFGGRAGVAEVAARRIAARLPELKVAGTRHGYFSDREEGVVTDEIRSSGAGLLMVALGNPLQERWLDRCLAATGARVGVGVGAFFDFQAGASARAPTWMNRVGIEWIHRLAHEPRRMWRRYLIGNPGFVLAVAHQRLDRAAPPTRSV
jgi:exopolysaccharide biosynthesis WecB/TagA/CpsF family protein